MFVIAGAPGCASVLGIDELTGAAPASAPLNTEWIYQFATNASETVEDIALVEEGLFVSGACACRIRSDRDDVGTDDARSPLLLGLTRDGSRRFHRTYDASGNLPSGLRVAGDGGDAVLAGSFVDELELRDTLFSDADDAFVAKASGQTGEVFWQRQIGGLSRQHALDVAIAGDDVYAVGSLEDTIDFGSGVKPGFGGEDAFVARFDDAFGEPRFQEIIGAELSQVVHRVDASESGAVAIAGLYGYGFSLIGALRTAGNGVFVSMFADGGRPKWLIGADADPANVHIGAVALGADDSVVVAGDFHDSLDFGSPMETGSGSDGFVVKLAPDGTHRWSSRIGGGSVGFRSCHDLAVDAAGDVFVAGDFDGVLQLGEEELEADGLDGFVAKLSGENGDVVWARHVAGPGLQSVRGIATDRFDRLYIAGHFDATIDLGQGRVSSEGEEDIFVAQLSASAP